MSQEQIDNAWEELYDAESDRVYYFNRITECREWTRPEGMNNASLDYGEDEEVGAEAFQDFEDGLKQGCCSRCFTGPIDPDQHPDERPYCYGRLRTSRQRCWVIFFLLLLLFLVILIPIGIFLIAPLVAQNLTESANVQFAAFDVSEPMSEGSGEAGSTNEIFPSVRAKVVGFFSDYGFSAVEIEPTTLTINYEGEVIGTLTTDTISGEGSSTARFEVDSVLVVFNQAVFDKFLRGLLVQEQVSIVASGSLKIKSKFLGIPLTFDDIALSKSIDLPGYNSLQDISVTESSLQVSNATNIRAAIVTRIFNPSVVAISPVGTLTFGIFFENVFMGIAYANSVSLLRGVNVVTLAVEIAPLPEDQAAAEKLLSEHLAGLPARLEIRPLPASFGQPVTDVALFNSALGVLALDVDLPGERSPLFQEFNVNTLSLFPRKTPRDDKFVDAQLGVEVVLSNPLGDDGEFDVFELDLPLVLLNSQAGATIASTAIRTIPVLVEDQREGDDSRTLRFSFLADVEILLEGDGSEWADFLVEYVSQEFAVLNLDIPAANAKTTTSLGLTELTLPVATSGNVRGLNNFKGTQITAFTVPEPDQVNGGAKLAVAVNAPNPSRNFLELGDTFFQVVYDDVVLGVIGSQNLTVGPGINALNFTGFALPPQGETAVIDRFFNNYVKGRSNPLSIVGIDPRSYLGATEPAPIPEDEPEPSSSSSSSSTGVAGNSTGPATGSSSSSTGEAGAARRLLQTGAPRVNPLAVNAPAIASNQTLPFWLSRLISQINIPIDFAPAPLEPLYEAILLPELALDLEDPTTEPVISGEVEILVKLPEAFQLDLVITDLAFVIDFYLEEPVEVNGTVIDPVGRVLAPISNLTAGGLIRNARGPIVAEIPRQIFENLSGDEFSKLVVKTVVDAPFNVFGEGVANINFDTVIGPVSLTSIPISRSVPFSTLNSFQAPPLDILSVGAYGAAQSPYAFTADSTYDYQTRPNQVAAGLQGEIPSNGQLVFGSFRTRLPNPTQLTLKLGQVAFDVLNEDGVRVAIAYDYQFSISPGENLVELPIYLFTDAGDSTQADAASAFLGNSIFGTDQPIQLKGLPSFVAHPRLTEAWANITLSTTLISPASRIPAVPLLPRVLIDQGFLAADPEGTLVADNYFNTDILITNLDLTLQDADGADAGAIQEDLSGNPLFLPAITVQTSRAFTVQGSALGFVFATQLPAGVLGSSVGTLAATFRAPGAPDNEAASFVFNQFQDPVEYFSSPNDPADPPAEPSQGDNPSTGG